MPFFKKYINNSLTNWNCFTDALQYRVTVFKRIITEKDVKMTLQLGLWIILMAAFN